MTITLGLMGVGFLRIFGYELSFLEIGATFGIGALLSVLFKYVVEDVYEIPVGMGDTIYNVL